MTKTDEMKLSEAKSKYPEAGRILLSQMTGLTTYQVRGWLEKTGRSNKPTNNSARFVTKQDLDEIKGIKVGEFLHKLDYPKIIRETIRKHCEEAFLPEYDFRMLTGLNQADFNTGKEAGKFHDNIFKQANVVYWSTIKNVAQAKKMRGT